MTRRYDIIVVGSGFSGSLLAWILASQGRSVLLIDRSKHPRFAVGESSTPTADFLLAYLAQRWNLPALAPLASWGQWKEHCPEILCGKKRGFSYYRHHPGQPLNRENLHAESMLVAASARDAWSDTHWVRSSVDAFLADQARSAGATLLESTQLLSARFDPLEHRWTCTLKTDCAKTACASTEDSEPSIEATWIVDATGHQGLQSPSIDNPDDSSFMHTRTGAVFGHFEGVAPFVAASSPEDPFCGDDAAQHHLLDEGWIWMLRFDHGVTSVGLVQPSSTQRSEGTFWEVLERHPSLAELMQHAKLVAPLGFDTARPTMGLVDRMSRCRARASGPGWVCLPVSYGFVDPLHSSGIAHSLSGVVRLAEALVSDRNDCYESIRTYGADLRREIQWLDLLVAGCYACQPSFESFIAYACLYFVSAIEFEKQLAVDPGRWPNGFMQSHDRRWVPVVNQAYEFLVRSGQTQVRNKSTLSQFPIQVRRWIEPWNRVGLLDPASANRISHSVAPKYASSIEGLCRSLAK